MRTLNQIDLSISRFMKKYGVVSLRIALSIIFIWFGILKVFGTSPAEKLVESTVYWMPFFSASEWVKIIGVWEVVIGITFLFKKTLRLAIALLALQMSGTFLPLIILTGVTFQPGKFPYAPSIEGQYIIKNLLIIAAALVVGGTVRDDNVKKK